jgi:hypothetical protein
MNVDLWHARCLTKMCSNTRVLTGYDVSVPVYVFGFGIYYGGKAFQRGERFLEFMVIASPALIGLSEGDGRGVGRISIVEMSNRALGDH